MRTCFYMDPLTVDPRKNGDLCSSTFLTMLYDGLTRFLPDGKVEFSLAQSVDISPDGKTYLFHLRKALWNDGHPITAYDFEYSWKKSLDPKFSAACPQLFFPILNAEKSVNGTIDVEEVGVKAIDAGTFEVKLEHPTPYFLSLISCSNFYAIPKHIAETISHWDATPTDNLVSSGPFKLVRWEKRKEICLTKNPLYWDAANTTLPNLKISIINTEYSTLEMFENDELDWISFTLSSLPLSALKTYQQAGRLTLLPTGATSFCSFNTQKFPFTNQNIRKAFSLAIDRKKLTDEVSQLNEIPASRCIPPILDGHTNHQILPPFSEKLARSYLQKGLAELRIPYDDNDLRFRLFVNNLVLSYSEMQMSRSIAYALQEQWRKVLGFTVKLLFHNYSAQMEHIMKNEHNIVLSIWIAQYNDPMNILERFKYRNLKKNYPGFENAEYIKILDSSFQKNSDKRESLLLEAEKLLLDQMPIAPLFHYNSAILSKPSVSGVEMSPFGGFQFKYAKVQTNKKRLTVAC